jgi:prolyl 4-hydroxylase
MWKILKNKKTFIAIVVILLCIILFFSYIKSYKPIIDAFNEISVLGYTDESAPYIEPKVFPNFITKEEADYIIATAKPKFKESTILGGLVQSARKSKTSWIDRNDEMVKPIIEKVCELEDLPFDNAEDLQVVEYQLNGYYNEHHDSCCEDDEICKSFLNDGGHRVATMLIYLTDDFEGGGTKFPNLDLELKPEKYSGILFHPLEEKNEKCHPNALHAGLPVIKGKKYVANVWLRQKEIIR